MLKLSIKQLRSSALPLDKVIAALVLFLGVVFIALPASSGRYTLHLPVIILASTLLYLGFRKRISPGNDLPQSQSLNRIRVISHIVFVISISLSTWLLWSNLYYRPPLYFVLLLVAASSILLDIFCLKEKGLDAFIPLFKIILLSLIVYGGIYYEFPGINGVDPWWHNNSIQETVNLGYISQGEFLGNTYYLFPMFHLTAAVTHLLTSLSIYVSVFISVGVGIAVSCLFVFLIGRRVVSTKAGLLAALIVPLTCDSIVMATAIIPMSLGFCFFSAILYLVFCRDSERSFSYVLLIILLSVAAILTHSIAALIVLVSLAAVFTGIKWYKQMNKPATAYEVVSLSLISLFGVVMLLRWMQTGPWGSFFDWQLEDAAGSILTDTQFIPITTLPQLHFPFLTSFQTYLGSLVGDGGFLVLLAFAIIGSLSCLHPQNRTPLKMALVTIAAVLFGIPQITWMLGLGRTILPDRWFVFLNVPLSILAVQGLLGVSNLMKSKLGKLSLIMVVVLAALFMMTATNRNTNKDSPFFYHGEERLAYTESEISAIRTLSTMGTCLPVTDRRYGTIFPYVMGYDSYMAMRAESSNHVFILRNYYLHHPEWNEEFKTYLHKGGIYRSPKSEEVPVLDYIKEQGIDKQPLIYSNGNVMIFTIAELD